MPSRSFQESEADTGGGIIQFLEPGTRSPGLSNKRIPVARPKIEERNPRGVEFGDCSEDPSDSEDDAAPSARAEAAGAGGQERRGGALVADDVPARDGITVSSRSPRARSSRSRRPWHPLASSCEFSKTARPRSKSASLLLSRQWQDMSARYC